MTRARALYEAFAARSIQYADEPTTSDPGRQTIRPPDQVLSRPRHATCLDLAVTFAGACLDAGLHPLIIVLAGARPGDPAHALVAVWLDGDWSNRAHREYRANEQDPDWLTLPPDLTDQLADSEDSPGAFLAIDVTGVASRIDAADPRRREQQSWSQSVAYGAALLREAAADRSRATLDIGLGYEHIEPHPLPYRPATDVLAPPYLLVPQDDHDRGPLKLLWARNNAIRFHPRDELDFLRDWFTAPDPLGPRTRIALLHGVGGAGKTRLAAELADQLSAAGWYGGFLVREPDPQDRAWLAEVASPLLVVVDYVEDRKSADVINVLRTLREREAPTCLLLTARSVSGWWEEEISVALKEDGHPYALHDSALAARHPRQAGVYRAALRSFGGSDGAAMGRQPPPDPNSGRWTTLDLVMLAWLAVQSSDPDELPGSEDELYERILEHELGYWVRAYRSQIGKPSKRTKGILREAGACLSLLAPREERLDHSLKAIKELTDEGKRRDEIAALFADLLPATPEDGTLAVRPDPLGSHLASSVFGADRALLRDCLNAADEDEQLNACVSVSRFAGARDESTAADIALAALKAHPDLWRPALSVAATQGGVFVGALEQFAATGGASLPLAELAVTVPIGHSTLRGLALIAAECSKPADAADTSEEALAARATWLNNLSVRQSDAGDREGALVSITEAVDLYRALAESNRAAFLPALASSLNNLSVQQSGAGNRDGALASITEAVRIRRALAESNRAAFLPDLAMSLNNLSNQQGGIGDREGALVSVTEGVDLYRALAESNRAAFLPALAGSLNNLSNRQSGVGDWDGALVSVTEAVRIRRALAESNRAAFLPDLAMSLNNLSVRQGGIGDREGALVSVSEAVELYRALAESNRAAFLPDLAMSLNNLSVQQSGAGDRDGALVSVTEAVELYRALAESNRAAFLPDLAMSLNNLSNRQSGAGDRDGALVSVTEAVELYRALAESNRAAFLPDLAGSLNNLSVQQSDIGDRDGALVSVTEAVRIRRALAESNRAAFLPDLAGSLNNLSVQQSDIGDRDGALVSVTEAVRIRRALAESNRAAFLPDLASSLNNLSVQQSDIGDRDVALVSITEAVQIYRALAESNRAAFLPALASSLNNLSNQQSDIGDRDVALVSITEAVQIYRALAESNRAAFLPTLAGSLNNLSNRQSDIGNLDDALVSVTEAVDLYRALAESNRAAFLPALAGSLNNLSVQQSGVGDRDGALVSVTEAVRIRRALAESNRAAFLPDLAMSLNNLSVQQGDIGDRDGALASITEAVRIRRALAESNRAAFLPDLASSLNNLSVQQGGAGDRDGALASITEAVRIRRALAESNRAAFLPDLASSLNNLSVQQGGAGDRDGALVSITEAVQIYRALAQTNPAAFLPDLAKSLNNLFDRQNERQLLGEAWLASDLAVSELTAGPQTELLVARARWRHSHDDHTGAATDLLRAAQCADETTDPVWAGRSRRAVRGFFEELNQDVLSRQSVDQVLLHLPAWTKDDRSPETVDLFNDWLSAPTWTEEAAFLRRAYSGLAAPKGRAALDLIRALYPEVAGLGDLADVLDAADERGLDQVLEEFHETHTRADLVRQWLATPTWPDDLEFLSNHPQLTADPLVRELLASQGDDPASNQHLGILQLAGHLPAPDVYDAVTDPATAHDTAMEFVEQGQLDALLPLFLAAPALRRMSFVAPYLFSVFSLFSTTTPESPRTDAVSGVPSPAELIAEAAAQSSEVQRGAGASRLRRLALRRPEHAEALLDLATLLTAAAPTQSSNSDVGADAHAD
ncbi:tetratricopeptide repeat protein [Streptomyces sp. RKAG337]|uniref:tetratricopeptide repeat protein n=1 Tax=Streptomyces sp. RKAG337 TaxID=2893404 RepID=UPI0020348D5E|nr:tetratricopeptide repeat protein [Streptomyces sp. RKAG337]MCM2428564.1 tetratricopeptide repeat protein [Streptomyces sp. RKAG337]